MTLEMDVLDDLVEDEGFIGHAYQDSLGYLTIGIGTCIDRAKNCGITLEEAKYLARNRLDPSIRSLMDALPHWPEYPYAVRRALANMAYQLGAKGLLGFHDMLAAIEDGDYGRAADEGMSSLWARQTPNRALKITNMIRSAA